jgi:fatty acid desaturase
MKIITKIHGKTYDLTNFKHPGGIIPFYLINGKDGTCLFESYHPVSNRVLINKVLQKYQIENNDLIKEENIYDPKSFDQDPFAAELKNEVVNYFKNISIQNNCSLIQATKMTFSRKIEIFTLSGLFLSSLYLFISNSIFGLFLMPFFLWLLTVNTYHDISHFAFSTNKYLEMFLLPLHFFIYPTFSWIIDHVYYHHVYPNIPNIDYDLERYIGFYQEPKISNNILLNNPLTNFLEFLIFSDKEKDKYRLYNNFNIVYVSQTICYLFVKIFFLKMMFYDKLINYGIFNALLFTFIPVIMFASLFLIFTQINHIHEENFIFSRKFYRQQVITAHNLSPESFIIRILSGGLNCQIEHHLFPSVNSCHLPKLSKIVRKLCKKYNIKYNCFNSIFNSVYDVYLTSKRINKKNINQIIQKNCKSC